MSNETETFWQKWQTMTVERRRRYYVLFGLEVAIVFAVGAIVFGSVLGETAIYPVVFGTWICILVSTYPLVTHGADGPKQVARRSFVVFAAAFLAVFIGFGLAAALAH